METLTLSSYVLLLFLIILNVVQLFTTAIVVTVHALAIVVNVVSAHRVRCENLVIEIFTPLYLDN